MIYLDNAATTKPKGEVIETFLNIQNNLWANPSSINAFGEEVFFALKNTRKSLANLIGAKENEIIFTSGATEGANQFIKSVLHRGGHVITSSYEHSAVYEVIKKMTDDIIYISPVEGIIDPGDVLSSIKDDTKLVCIMHVNNEIGAINNIYEITRLVKQKNKDICVFSDGVQAIGKINVDVNKLGVDGYIASAHKFHGLKGTGFLYTKKQIKRFIDGGGQENGYRSGTENVAGIISLCKALEIADKNLNSKFSNAQKVREYFVNNLDPDFKIITCREQSPYILNVCIKNIKPEVLVHMLDEDEIYIGTKSACSKNSKTSRVLDSLKLPKEYESSCIRISFSGEENMDDMKMAVEKINFYANKLKELR